jgi:hypothetical protein
MTGRAFTPAPWRVERIERDDGEIDYEIWADRLLACVYDSAGCVATGPVKHASRDASLIAAAPDLFEALADCIVSVRGKPRACAIVCKS